MSVQQLSFENFFTNFYIIHPDAETLSKDDHKTALIASVILGVCTLGLLHLGCAIAERCITPQNEDESEVLKRTHRAADPIRQDNRAEEPPVDAPFDWNVPPADLDHFRGDNIVTIKSLSGQSFFINYGDGANVIHLKHFIFEAHPELGDVPFMRLILAGKQLQDDQELAPLRLHERACVHLIIRQCR